MKQVVFILIGLVLVGVAVAAVVTRSGGDDAASSEVVSARATAGADQPASSEELLQRVVDAYRSAPVLTDTMSVVYTTAGGSRTLEYQVVLGPDDQVYLKQPGSEMMAIDGAYYAVLDSVKHKYFKSPINQDLASAYVAASGGRVAPMQLALRYAPTEQVVGHAFGQLANARLGDHRLVTNEQGQERYELTVTGDNGQGSLLIDPASWLVDQSKASFTAPRSRGTNQAAITCSPKVESKLSKPIQFDPGDRVQVSSMAALSKVSIGEPAPDFTLTDLSGRQHTLSDYRGSVVILDYWATWCGPCRKGLPLLEQFHVQAESQGLPVKVFAVDLWERGGTEQQNMAKVKSYWESQKFTMPTLLDFGGDTARPYGINSIPTTIIIGPDGKVAKLHKGFDANMVQTLTRDVQELMGG